MESVKRPSTRGVLISLLVVALALRLPWLDRSLWFDEACMSKQRIGSLGQLLTTIYIDIHPPLYLGFCFVWNTLLGDAEVVMRIPALLAGLASLPLAYVVAERTVGRAAALWTVALLAVSPVHVWYSDEARLYAPMLCGVLAAAALLTRLLAGGGRRSTWWLYAAVVGGLLSLHYYLAAYVLAFSLVAWCAPRAWHADAAAARRVLWIHGAGLALLAAWVALKAALIGFETSQEYMGAFGPLALYRFLFQWCWTGNALPAGLDGASLHARWVFWVLFQALGVLLFARGVVELWRRRAERPQGATVLLYALTLPALLLVLPLLGFASTYIERSALPALPFLFMVVALGLTSLRIEWQRRAAGFAVAALALAGTVALFAFDERWTVYKPHEDWRAAAGWFADELEAGGAGRPVFTPLPSVRSLPYYDARIQDAKGIAPSSERFAASVGSLRRVLGARVGGVLASVAESLTAEVEADKTRLRAGAELLVHPIGDGSLAGLDLERHLGERSDRTFYLVSSHWHPPGDTRVAALLADPDLRLLRQRDFRGVSVYALEYAPAEPDSGPRSGRRVE